MTRTTGAQTRLNIPGLQIRISKSEMPDKLKTPMIENAESERFGVRIWDFGFVSDLAFEISDFVKPGHSSARLRPQRRGVVTIWTILCMPLLMTILYAVAEVAHLWQARVQLENAVEAAVLATVQEWGRRGGGAKHVGAALSAGQAFGEANAVHGIPVRLSDRKRVPKVAWSFGTASPSGNGYQFTPDTEATAKFAVILQATVRTPRLCRPLLGASLGEATVTAASIAFYDPSESPPRPRLIRVAADR